MKFAEHLSAHITPEWRKQYINYEEMKAMLYTAQEEAPSLESVDPEIITKHFRNFDEHFFHFCDKELKKIDTFFSEKLAEATRKYATLVNELKTAMAAADSKYKLTHSKKGFQVNKPTLPARKIQELKLAFSEFYLSLILLQNYQTLNHTGFRKIFKKHDKLLNTDLGARWQKEHVDTARFFTSSEISKLLADTEATVINELEHGDRQKAMKRLRVPPLGETQSPWTTFKLGLFSGSFIVLLIAVILSAVFHATSLDTNILIAFRLYRGPFLIILFLFLIGANVYGWRSSGVNHVLIFELDPRNHLHEQHIMEMAAVFGVVWTLSLLSFFYSSTLSIPPYVNPLALIIILIAFVVNPVKVFRHEARFWFLRVCLRMVLAPFFHVGFADFWLADQLNSLVTAILDLHFLVCFYLMNDLENVGDESFYEHMWFTRAIVNCLPAWFRFAQCLRRYRDSKEAFPHLVNAGKYASTFFVVIFATLKSQYSSEYLEKKDNPFLYCWVVACIVNSIYTYTWDIKMDWGLFEKNSNENKFLREEIVYSCTWYYYLAIFEDLVLRFVWIPVYFLTESHIVNTEIITSITSPLEVIRRFIWNFFRLENEHLNNCGKFRAVRDISVAPINSSDQVQMIRMMDDEDGVKHRKEHHRRTAKKLNKDDKRPLLLDESLLESRLSPL